MSDREYSREMESDSFVSEDEASDCKSDCSRVSMSKNLENKQVDIGDVSDQSDDDSDMLFPDDYSQQNQNQQV